MNPRQTGSSQIDRAPIIEAAKALRMIGISASSPARLMSLLCDDRVGGDELTSRIETQPALCGQVLRVANAPFYGQVRTVTTIKRALLLLGSNTIRGIAAAACMDELMPSTCSALPDVAAVVRHSLATAVAAETLAMIEHPMLAADAFIAGILHNLGVVLQASMDPAGTVAMIASRPTDRRGIRELEQTHSVFHHEDCAAVLFENWLLPESIVAAAQYHHLPSGAPEIHRLLVTLVSVAADLALCCGYTYSLEPEAPELSSELLGKLGLVCDDDVNGIVAALPSRINDLTLAFR